MPLKTPAHVIAALRKRLDGVWHLVAAGADAGWRARVPLGAVSSTEMAADWPGYTRQVAAWHDWAQAHEAELSWTSRRVGQAAQRIPDAVLVNDPDAAAHVVGAGYPERLAAGRAHAACLRAQFPGTTTDVQVLARLVKAVDGWSDLDMDLLVAAGRWFATHDGAGMTPRQIPVEGMHAKWLNATGRQTLVATLAGIHSLGLAAPHPPVVSFTYLDPIHLAAGGRRHDSHTVGDVDAVAYQPRVVLICENKDTVMVFPPVPGGIAVQGAGAGAGAVAKIPWVAAAPLVVYWGDMDADGLEILAEHRAAGVVNASLFMDVGSWERFERWGTDHDRNGRVLAARAPRAALALGVAEYDLYRRLCGPNPGGHRRVEQERIPIDIAYAVLQGIASARLG